VLCNRIEKFKPKFRPRLEYIVYGVCLRYRGCIQCEPRVLWHFSQTVGNFLIKFYTSITRSQLRCTTNFYSIICNFDEVKPYCARPPSSHHTRKMFAIGQNACWHFLTFFPNSWEFLVQTLHAYYTFPYTLEYKFLFNYRQL